MTGIIKQFAPFLLVLFLSKKANTQSVIEWPAAIVEMHYNNTGPDVDEYLEVHLHYTLYPGYFPCPCTDLSEIRLFNGAGILYKTITPGMLSYFSAGGWSVGYGPHFFGYYQFPPGDDFADEGKIQLINIIPGGPTTVMAEYVYNSAGITEYRNAGPIFPRFFPVTENETTPVGASLNFCGYFYNSLWNAYIMASSFAATSSCLILPVQISDFNYSVTNSKVRLQWKAAVDPVNSFFDVERSMDGIHFRKLGTVSTTGIAYQPAEYTFMDDKPAEINYYRIKQVDLDGKTSYTKTILVKMNSRDGLKIYPAITNDQLQIQVGFHSQVLGKLELLDLQGRILQQFNVKPGLNQLSVSHLQSGSYFLRLQTKEGVLSGRFIKQ